MLRVDLDLRYMSFLAFFVPTSLYWNYENVKKTQGFCSSFSASFEKAYRYLTLITYFFALRTPTHAKLEKFSTQHLIHCHFAEYINIIFC